MYHRHCSLCLLTLCKTANDGIKEAFLIPGTESGKRGPALVLRSRNGRKRARRDVCDWTTGSHVSPALQAGAAQTHLACVPSSCSALSSFGCVALSFSRTRLWRHALQVEPQKRARERKRETTLIPGAREERQSGLKGETEGSATHAIPGVQSIASIDK